MSARTSSVKRRFVPASQLVEALAGDIAKIKSDDKLTYADIGAVLHKSEDMAAKYADGSATMDFISYLRGRDQWNGRFTGSVERLLDEARDTICPRHTQTLVLLAATALARALEDGELDERELIENAPALTKARDAIDAQLARLKPRSVA